MRTLREMKVDKRAEANADKRKEQAKKEVAKITGPIIDKYSPQKLLEDSRKLREKLAPYASLRNVNIRDSFMDTDSPYSPAKSVENKINYVKSWGKRQSSKIESKGNQIDQLQAKIVEYKHQLGYEEYFSDEYNRIRKQIHETDRQKALAEHDYKQTVDEVKKGDQELEDIKQQLEYEYNKAASSNDLQNSMVDQQLPLAKKHAQLCMLIEKVQPDMATKKSDLQAKQLLAQGEINKVQQKIDAENRNITRLENAIEQIDMQIAVSSPKNKASLESLKAQKQQELSRSTSKISSLKSELGSKKAAMTPINQEISKHNALENKMNRYSQIQLTLPFSEEFISQKQDALVQNQNELLTELSPMKFKVQEKDEDGQTQTVERLGSEIFAKLGEIIQQRIDNYDKTHNKNQNQDGPNQDGPDPDQDHNQDGPDPDDRSDDDDSR